MKAFPILLLAAPAILLSGCGDDSSSTQTANVSFAVSDAPVDEASSVTIGFTQIELVKSNGESITLDVEPSTESNDYEQIDLLDYQGQDSALLVTQQPIPVGTYKNLILHISNEANVNFVVDNEGTQELKQPSNKLKLGSFEVTADATQQFTIEFDLRQSLVMRGNNGSTNGYILKPHGVTIMNNSEAASLAGVVDPTWFDDTNCSESVGNFVYLYQGDAGDKTLVDLIDEIDSEFNTGDALPASYIAPYASAGVNEQGQYEFGYLPSGNYTLAFSCNVTSDDPIQYDALSIPSPANLVSPVTLFSGEQSTVDFEYE